MDNKFYRKHEIKRGWNHKLAPKVRALNLDPLTQECLQALCKWGKVFLYKGTKRGLPSSLKPQLGYAPTNEDIIISLKELQRLGYANFMGGEKDGTKRELRYAVDEMKINRDAGYDAGNFGDSLF